MAIKLIATLSGVKIESGRLQTPSGTEFIGFKVTIGGVTDPASVTRTYDDIERILGKNKVDFKTHEEKSPNGTFRSYTVET